MRNKIIILTISLYLILSCRVTNLVDVELIPYQSDIKFEGLKGDVKSIEYFEYFENGNLQEHQSKFYNDKGDIDSVFFLDKKKNVFMSDYYIRDSIGRRLKLYKKIGETKFLMKDYKYSVDEDKKVLVDYYLRPESKERDGVIVLYYNHLGQLIKTLDSTSNKLNKREFSYHHNNINSSLATTKNKDSVLTTYKDGVEEITSFYSGGKLSLIKTFNFIKYDNKGNWTEAELEVNYLDKKEIFNSSLKRKIKYY